MTSPRAVSMMTGRGFFCCRRRRRSSNPSISGIMISKTAAGVVVGGDFFEGEGRTVFVFHLEGETDQVVAQ